VINAVNALELAATTHEVVLPSSAEGCVTPPTPAAGNFDLGEYLDRYRDQRLVLIIAPIGEAEPATYTCGVCGFVMNEAGECPRCRMTIEEGAVINDEMDGAPDILDHVRELLDGADADVAQDTGD
jgi:hypothetical protein